MMLIGVSWGYLFTMAHRLQSCPAPIDSVYCSTIIMIVTGVIIRVVGIVHVFGSMCRPPIPSTSLTCLTLPSSILTSTVGTCTSTSNTTLFIVPVTYSTGHTSQVECPLMTDYTFSGPVNITQDYCQVVLPDCVCSHVSELGSSSSQEFKNWGCVGSGTLFPM